MMNLDELQLDPGLPAPAIRKELEAASPAGSAAAGDKDKTPRLAPKGDSPQLSRAIRAGGDPAHSIVIAAPGGPACAGTPTLDGQAGFVGGEKKSGAT